MKYLLAAATLGIAALSSVPASASSVKLYEQNFEAPNNPPGFINRFGSQYSDLSQQQVNDLYGGQFDPSFAFAQQFTVETMLLNGTNAGGFSSFAGYNDTTGQGGSYAIGMLSSVQNDLLGLSFDIGEFDFFNFKVDISAVGLFEGPGSPFGSDSIAPKFKFTLFDNPSGVNGTGAGTILDSKEFTGVASPITDLVWTTDSFAMDASQATNGKVILQVDLLEGGYAVMDNWLITASDEELGGLEVIPLPAGLPLMLGALGAFALIRRRS